MRGWSPVGLVFLAACGGKAKPAAPPEVSVPPAPVSAASTDPPRQKNRSDSTEDPEVVARRYFDAAFRGDEAAVRELIASYEEVSAVLTREMSEADYASSVTGYVHDFVAPKDAERSTEFRGVKLLFRKTENPDQNSKVRRAVEIAVVRLVVGRGDVESVAPFNFEMIRTPRGWRFVPGG